MVEKTQSLGKKQPTKTEQPAHTMGAGIYRGTHSSSEQMFLLQQTVGNQAAGRLLHSGRIQSKLKINAPGDEYEQEADSVADRIMRMPEQGILQRNSLHVPPFTPVAQNVFSGHAAINNLKSGGQPLPESTRSYFEPRFGVDFSSVRIRADREAAEAAHSIHAKAFTYDNTIAFNAGEYAPESRTGQELIAHELTHVVQQGQQRGSTPDVQRVDGNNWKWEQEMASHEAAAAQASVKIEGDTEYWGGYAMQPDEKSLEVVLRAVIAAEGLRGAENFAMNYRFHFGWTPEQSKLRERIIPILDKKLEELKTYATAYVNTFRPVAVANLKRVLADSKKVVDKEAEKYGLTTTHERYMLFGGGISSTTHTLAENKETGDMVAAAKEILAKDQLLRDLDKKRESYKDKTYGCVNIEESGMRLSCKKMDVVAVKITDPVAYKQVSDEIDREQQEYAKLRAAHEGRYPILSSFRPPEKLDELKTIAEGSKAERDRTVGEDIEKKLKNIAEINDVADDDSFVWKQPSILIGAKKELGVMPGSLEDRAIDAKVEAVADSERLRNLTLGFISLIGALLAAIPSGGSSLAVWGVGAFGTGLMVGAGGISIYEGIREYEIQRAATGTAFEKARAISQEDPSMFWLAFMIVVSVADFAASVAFFARAARAIRTMGAVGDIDAMARAAYRDSELSGVVSEEEFVQQFKANMKAPPDTGVPDVSAEARGAQGLFKLPKPGTILARGPSEEAVKATYFQAMRRSSQEGVEVGIFRKRLLDGTDEYIVVQGSQGKVPPMEGYISVSHTHANVEGKVGFQNPAPQDMSVSVFDYAKRPPDEKGLFVQKVHSHGPDGGLIEVEYGVDPATKNFFVKRPGEMQKQFMDIYPDSLRPQVNAARWLPDPKQQLEEVIRIFKTLDSDKYYAGWWARQF